MSYELINRSNKLPIEISDYEYSRLPRKDQSKYKKIAGRTRKDDSDRSHVGTSFSDNNPAPYFQDKGYDTTSNDDSFAGFGGGSGGGAGAGGSWEDTGSSDSGSSSGSD